MTVKVEHFVRKARILMYAKNKSVLRVCKTSGQRKLSLHSFLSLFDISLVPPKQIFACDSAESDFPTISASGRHKKRENKTGRTFSPCSAGNGYGRKLHTVLYLRLDAVAKISGPTFFAEKFLGRRFRQQHSTTTSSLYGKGRGKLSLGSVIPFPPQLKKNDARSSSLRASHA